MGIGAGYILTEREFQSERKMNDWRLQGQEKYLTSVELERKKYQPYREGWDHDHCEFCGAKFSLVEPGSLCIGYVTSTNYHWICDSCFADFKEKFGWTTKSE
jgi:hypothetical protein